jgi:hypothetical protein
MGLPGTWVVLTQGAELPLELILDPLLLYYINHTWVFPEHGSSHQNVRYNFNHPLTQERMDIV